MTRMTAVMGVGVLAIVAFFIVSQDEKRRITPAENVWVGKLVDAECKRADPEPACPVGPATKEFAMSVDGGRILYFDAKGNELALELMKETGAGGNIPARAVGEREDRTLAVESLEFE